jgi:FAD/FMN-containing dehydrogenase
MITVSNFLSRVPPLFSPLAKLIAGDVDCSIATLTRYSGDGSPYRISPQAVIYPKTSTDIKHILSFAREYKMPITVRGNGTGRSGGSLGEGVIVDLTKYFSHIRQVAMLENTITVDAGVSVKALREKLHAINFDIPFLSSYDNDSTIGGLIATRSVAPTTFHHGTIREWVQSMNIIVDTGEEHTLADGITPSGRLLGIYQAVFPILTEKGALLRAAKRENASDNAGYNLWNTSIGPRQLIDQLVGSEGTLAIITSVTFRITPLHTHIVTTCVPIEKKEDLPRILDIARKNKAEHIFLYDEAFRELSRRYYPEILPETANTPYTLLVTHTAPTKEKLLTAVHHFKKLLGVNEYDLASLPNQGRLDHITEYKYLYSLFDAYTKKTQTPVALADGIIVPMDNYVALLDLLEQYLYSLGRLYTVTGNVASGHISVITLFDQRSPTYEKELAHYTETIASYVQKYKGSLSAAGGEGIVRSALLMYIYNDVTLGIFKDIKNAWDPLSVLNPGKKLGTSLHYLKEHLARTYETEA